MRYRHDRPSHTLTPKQLSKEITDVHRIIHTARQAAVTAAFTDSDSDDNSATAAAAVTGPRTKWFRPGWGWFTPEVVDTAQKLGYHVVLGSVWPWDVYCKWPLLNALYIATKVYPGAVVVLHDRCACLHTWCWQESRVSATDGPAFMAVNWQCVCRTSNNDLACKCGRQQLQAGDIHQTTHPSSLQTCLLLLFTADAPVHSCWQLHTHNPGPLLTVPAGLQAPPPAANPAVRPALAQPNGL